MIFLCDQILSKPIFNNLITESLLQIILGGIGGVIIASLITIFYENYKHCKRVKNLFKGFISEMEVNKEYLKHNYDLSKIILSNKEKPTIFIPVRKDVCEKILTSGEIKLDYVLRKDCSHYLVTLDHLNQMIKTLEFINKNDSEYNVALKRINRYCRFEATDININFDYILKHINNIQNFLILNKRYLKRYFRNQ